jgi:hypothetical protein
MDFALWMRDLVRVRRQLGRNRELGVPVPRTSAPPPPPTPAARVFARSAAVALDRSNTHNRDHAIGTIAVSA